MELTKLSIIFCLINLKLTVAHPQKSQICSSQECHLLADTLLSKIDNSVSPCDDFYQFACGNHKRSSQFDPLEVIEKVLNKRDKESDSKYLEIARKVYKSCMYGENHWKNIANHKLESIKWPLKEDSNYENLQKFITQFQFPRFLNGYYFSLSSNQISKTENILMISSPCYVLVNSNETKYHQNIEDIVSHLNFYTIDLNDIFDSMYENFMFKQKLTKILKSKATDKSSTVTTVKELQSKIFSAINWTEFLNEFFDGRVKITDNYKILVNQVETLKEIEKLISESPNHVVANFIVWDFLENIYFGTDITLFNDQNLPTFEQNLPSLKQKLPSLEQNSQNFDPSVYKTLNFVNSDYITPSNLAPKTKSFRCTEDLSEHLKILSSAIYGREVFTDDLKAELNDMLWIIKRQLQMSFESSDWLDEKTKSAAIKKLQKMRFVIGYPEEFDDNEFFEDYYKRLDFDTQMDYSELILNIFDFNKAKFIENFVNPNELQLLEIPLIQATTVNALMDPLYNKVFLHAAFIKFVQMSTSIPRSVIYSTIGAVLGHEIFHGYDNNLRHLDYNGDDVNWWETEADQEFLNRSQCLIDQYGNFTEPVTGLNVNGTQTLGENIADNGGFLLAYNSYQKWLKINKIDQTLPNVNFTSNQLFWLSTAHFWCGNRSYDDMKFQIETDSHSPERIRVLGTMSNLKEFSDDFQCPKGSKMNPEHKCKVW